MKLEDILKFIRDSDNKNTLPLIESTISETKKKQFYIGSKVIFGRANGKQHFGTIEKDLEKSKSINNEYDIKN